MKLILIGASGTIGAAVAAALSPRHEVVGVTRHTQPLHADITSRASIRALLEAVGPVDGIVCASGAARFKPLELLDDEDFAFSLQHKLMGQVNVIREGIAHVRDHGVIVVTSGILARSPSPGSSAVSLVNAGLEAFVHAASLEAPRGIRVDAVSPPWVSETLVKLGRDPATGLPASAVAEAYVHAVEGTQTGRVIEPQGNAGR